MEVISIEEQSFYKLIDTVLAEMQEKFGNQKPEWLSEKDTMQLLGVRSKSTLQKLRDTDAVKFSQPRRKIILYHRPSLLEYLEAHSNK